MYENVEMTCMEGENELTTDEIIKMMMLMISNHILKDHQGCPNERRVYLLNQPLINP